MAWLVALHTTTQMQLFLWVLFQMGMTRSFKKIRSTKSGMGNALTTLRTNSLANL